MMRSKPSLSPWPLATAFALAGTVAGILLTGTSVWFLGAVALAGAGPAALTFNFHVPAALIRLFALTKTLTKYGERIFGHQAALHDQVKRRAQLFVAMATAPEVRRLSWQLGNQDRLSDYMDDVEDLDFARLRTAIPQLTIAVAAAFLTAATLWVAPLALLPIIAIAAVLFLALSVAKRRAIATALSVRSDQREAGAILGAAFSALPPLKAEAAFSPVLQDAFERFEDMEAARLAQQHAFATLDAMMSLAGPLAAVSVLGAAWYGGLREEALLVPAFVAFAWFAFGEALQSASRILLGKLRADQADKAVAEWSKGSDAGLIGTARHEALHSVEMTAVPRMAIDGRRLGDPLSITFHAGYPTALIGPSGSGKTTLLKQIAGWIGGDDDQYQADARPFPGRERQAACHLSLHDAAILDGSVRENLFAPHATDGECWQALTVVELLGRVMAAGGLDGWIRQDMLSSGEAQRLNLARALLCRSPVVLFDEPGEHLATEQSTVIFGRVLQALKARIVIFSSHDLQLAARSQQIDLS